MQAVAQESAASWGHVNLLGEYDLSEERQRYSVGIQLPKIYRLDRLLNWECRNAENLLPIRQLSKVL